MRFQESAFFLIDTHVIYSATKLNFSTGLYIPKGKKKKIEPKLYKENQMMIRPNGNNSSLDKRKPAQVWDLDDWKTQYNNEIIIPKGGEKGGIFFGSFSLKTCFMLSLSSH